MFAGLARLRRGPRPRTADDDDWGTASPPYDIPSRVDHHVPDSFDTMPVEETQAVRGTIVERLKQQELQTYTWTYSPRIVITLYFAIAILFMPLGSAVVAGTSRVRGVPRTQYSQFEGGQESCQFNKNENGTDDGIVCFVSIDVNETIPAPSYFYYSLTNYFQNHREYAKSRSDIMHQGIEPSILLDVDTCSPFLYRDGTTEGAGGFDISEFRYPCGLTARSFFNDSFSLCKDQACNNPVRTNSRNIALWTDAIHKFNQGENEVFKQKGSLEKRFPSANELFEDQHFIVWMRLGAFSDFDKLYTVIEEPLEANMTYHVTIESRYDVSQFNGTKSFKITTVAWFGAANVFLGTAYLVVGFTALVIACTLLAKHLRNPRLPANVDPEILLRELAKLNIDHRTPP